MSNEHGNDQQLPRGTRYSLGNLVRLVFWIVPIWLVACGLYMVRIQSCCKLGGSRAGCVGANSNHARLAYPWVARASATWAGRRSPCAICLLHPVGLVDAPVLSPTQAANNRGRLRAHWFVCHLHLLCQRFPIARSPHG